tara:strand:- start:452 stop:772 length:321 start_codon:yes stop_codon:yes gene_type:complete
MKILKISISIIFLFYIGIKYSFAEDCNKFQKLSKEFAECNAKLFKKNAENLKIKTSEKTESLKRKATAKIDKSKKNFNNSKLKEKLIIFKNSKNHKEFMKKINNDN